MDKRQGFTLIELLVVISITALLIAILIPALTQARKQAKSAVCQMQLKQWGTIFSMYTDSNNGYFNRGYLGHHASGRTMWIEVLRPYYEKADIRCCPMAAKPAVPEGAGVPAGGKFKAWGVFDGSIPWGEKGDYGSYGINMWVSNRGRGEGGDRPASYSWKTPNVKGAGNVPLFLGCWWFGCFPKHNDDPPKFDGDKSEDSGRDQMKRFCLNRHNGAINGALLDFSVRKIGLKELWKLKWHREYDTNGPWTIAGGVQPDDWPEWMRKFRDF